MGENYILSMDTGTGVLQDAPSVCQEALAALSSPYATSEEIGGIISKDRAIVARMLQATNSAYFGLPRKVTDVAEAVNLLGFQTVTNMLLDFEALASSRKRKAGMFLTGLVSNSSGQDERKAAIPSLS